MLFLICHLLPRGHTQSGVNRFTTRQNHLTGLRPLLELHFCEELALRLRALQPVGRAALDGAERLTV
jgi:hypothetical protein